VVDADVAAAAVLPYAGVSSVNSSFLFSQSMSLTILQIQLVITSKNSLKCSQPQKISAVAPTKFKNEPEQEGRDTVWGSFS